MPTPDFIRLMLPIRLLRRWSGDVGCSDPSMPTAGTLNDLSSEQLLI
jgi:hypothetical protein